MSDGFIAPSPEPTAPTLSAADMGGIGEAMLKQWAHEAGISPNPATNDVKGFDYLLVLSKTRDSTATNPLDLDPPELSCLVQVKATRNADRPIAVKLSNWERLAKSPLPAFFLVVEVGATNKVGRAFASIITSPNCFAAALNPSSLEVAASTLWPCNTT